MAITNTYYTHSVAGGTGATRTFSITVPSGSDQILLVSFATNDGDQANGFTSVTFGGTAMTLLDSTVISGTIGVVTYYLVNPPAGTANVVWTNSSVWTAGVYFSTVFAGVDQTTPILQNVEKAGNWVDAAGSVVNFTSVTDAVAYNVAAAYYTGTVTVNGSATKLSSGVIDGIVQCMTAHSEAAASSIGWSGWGATELKFASNVAVLKPSAGGGGGTDATASGGEGISTGSGSGGTATGGGSGTFTFSGGENNTHSGPLVSEPVNWAWHSGGNVGSASVITNGSGTLTSAGMTITGLPAGPGYGIVRSSDGTVVGYKEGTVT